MALDMNDPEVKREVESLIKASVSTAVEEATTGLKTKNQQILDEKKKIEQQLTKFDGIDVEAIKELQARFENDDDAKLISEGKIDEVIGKRFEKTRLNYEQQLSESKSQIESLQKESMTYQQRYEGERVETALRAAAEKAKVVPEAIDDVILRGKGLFSVDDDGSIVIRNAEGKIVVNDKEQAINPTNFVDDLKEKAPHYWRSSQSAGFSGNDADIDSLQRRIMQASKSGDMKEYKRLRDIQRGKTK